MSMTADKTYFRPDLERLRLEGRAVEPATAEAALALLGSRVPLSNSNVASLLKAMLQPGGEVVAEAVSRRGAEVRQKLFGNQVVPMAPVEIANTCASDCLFCGWRVSNRAMKRLKMPTDLAMLQVEYLLDRGIHYIEFVSGDDIQVVRNQLPELIQRTRQLFDERGIRGKIAFCTLALTEPQYADLKAAGADSMVVWQETYDPAVFAEHVVNGPKAYGVTDEWKVDRAGDGCAFRIESQERAMRAGLEVALGSMLGLNPDICTEFLATVEHVRYLHEAYGSSAEHPIIIGMPIWNAITTRETDLRPKDAPSLQRLFPALAALYLLALPNEGTWVFPNCRVPLAIQVEAARVAGAFSSTEVKLGPGGYLPSIIREQQARGVDTRELVEKVKTLLRESGEDVDALQRALDEREQFLHHYHEHARYEQAMSEAGLQLVRGVQISV
jgi:2-iminoacetate synthase ThiH